MRRVVVIGLMILLLFPAPVLAEEANGGVLGEKVAEMEEQPGIFERSVAELIISPANWILNLLGMTDPVILVFGKNPSQDETGFMQGDCAGRYECSDDLSLGVFESDLMGAIDALYGTFERFVPFPLVIALVLIAFLVLIRAADSGARIEAKDYIAAFLLGVIALRFGYYLWVLAANVVQTFTDMIWATMMDSGIQPALFLELLWGTKDGYDSALSVKSIGLAVLVLIAALMVIVINYQYMVRKIMLMVLIVLFPVTCVLTVFPKFRHSMQTWWDEFLSNLVLPAAHALALGLFFLMMKFSLNMVSMWLIVVYLFALPIIAGLVRKLVGAQDSAGGVWGGMTGFAGLAGLVSITKMMRPKNSGNKAANGKTGEGMSGGSTGISDTPGSDALAGAAGSSGPSSATVSSASAAPASTSPGAMRHRALASKAVSYGGRAAGYGLRFAGTAAGAMIGYAAGVMTGNSGMATAGTMIGGSIGRKAVDIGGRTISLAIKGAAWTGRKLSPYVERASHAIDRQPTGLPKVEIPPNSPDKHSPAENNALPPGTGSRMRLERHNELEKAYSNTNHRRDYYV